MTERSTLVAEETLTLPYGVLRTVHNGASEVRVYRDLLTQTKQVGKRLSLMGREDNLVTEVSLLREISHKNVAEVYVVTEVAGKDPALAMVEIIMPYYERGSVFDAMVKEDKRYSIAEAREVTVRALRGLAHLHDRHRILHRDLKPANLFLASDGSVVKIGDFGEAMRMDADETSDPLVSPQFWTPPETFTGERYSVRAEIYSMGMSLLEMVSGPLPYEDYGVENLSQRLASGRPAVAPRHLQFPPHIPESMRRIVRKAIRPEPLDRFSSADAMLQALLRARFVDWKWPQIDEQWAEWEGSLGDSDLKVLARPVRGRGWRAHCERRYESGWRKVSGCPVVDGEDAFSAASTVFAHVDRHLARA